MKTSENDLPSPAALCAGLRMVTETLAGALATPTRHTPDWTELEWQLARAVAALHGVSALLAQRLEWNGPPGWKLFLETQRAHVAARHVRIEALLAGLDAQSLAKHLPLIALKGAALHALGLYCGGERPMADIDLLVRPQDAERARQVLESLGFSESFANWKHRVFTPVVQEVHAGIGEHERNYLKIELHERIAEVLPLRVTDVTAAVFPQRPQPGLNGYPSLGALMIHLLVHAASAMAYRALRMLHLHDIALVAGRMTGPDWEELLRHDRSGSGPWWALPPLELTARYYPAVVPADVLTALSRRCPWNLRRLAGRRTLSDVSMSYMWVEAFPGIEWSRSVAEIIEYVATRVRPSAETMRLRTVLADTQVANSNSEWGRLSQGRRVLKWIASRPLRADTLHAVRLALAQPH